MLLNNLLRPNLRLFFYSLFYISSMEGKGFVWGVKQLLILLHTRIPSGLQTASHMMVVPFCDFSFTLTSLPVVNFIFEHYQQPRSLESHTKLLCQIVLCGMHPRSTIDFGSYVFWKL